MVINYNKQQKRWNDRLKMGGMKQRASGNRYCVWQGKEKGCTALTARFLSPFYSHVPLILAVGRNETWHDGVF